MAFEGDYMSFTNPGAFWLLLVLLPVGIISFRGYSLGKKDLRTLGGRWREKGLFNVYLIKWFFRTLFFFLAIISMILALAGIRWGEEPQTDDRKEIDISLVVDLSRSMYAEDVSPNRLLRLAQAANIIISALPEARFNLIGFSGEASLFVPFTEDRLALTSFFDDPKTIVTAKGSNLEKALDLSLNTFPPNSERFQVMVLFTDGEFHTGTPGVPLEALVEKQIPILVAAVGTETGGRIPAESGDFVTDSEGNIVESRLDIPFLEKVADMTRGELVYLSDFQAESQMISYLRGFIGESESIRIRFEKISRYRLFLLLAFLFFIIHLLIRVIKWKKTF